MQRLISCTLSVLAMAIVWTDGLAARAQSKADVERLVYSEFGLHPKLPRLERFPLPPSLSEQLQSLPPAQRPRIDRAGIRTCEQAIMDVDGALGNANWHLRKQEIAFGGPLEWTEAEAIRRHLGFGLRLYMKDMRFVAFDGRGELCETMRNRAIRWVDEVIHVAMTRGLR